MKRLICLILSLILTLSLWGCGKEETAQETTLPEPKETVRYGHTPTEAAPTETTETPTEAEVTVEVKDVFVDKAVMLDYDETYYYHIPSIHISGVNTDEVNKLMYHELYSFIDQYVYENPDYPYLGDMGYLWTVREGIVSVITEVIIGPDSSPNPMYIIYNVDIATGQQVSDEDLIASFGLEKQTYRDQVAAALAKTYVDLFAEYHAQNPEDSFYQTQYDNTVSEDNINNVRPYIDVTGELCVMADIYSLAGADCYRHLVCVSGAVEPSYPKAEPFE